MVFQPLGYSFECRSPMTPAAVKAAIRKGKKGWFESQNGARGWIVGPIVCLWLSAFDRHGPMAVGIVKQDGAGSRVVGRAGADLNGTAMFLLLTPVMAWLVYQMAQRGQGSIGQHIILGLVFGIGLPLTLWFNSKDRRAADPLVHFIHRAVTPSYKSARASKPPSPAQRASVRLIVDGVERAEVSADQLSEALSALSVGDTAILEFAPEEYMQALSTEDQYVLEKREGSAAHHFQAILPKGSVNEHQKYEACLAQLTNVMTAYLFRQAPSVNLDWKRITL